MGEDRLWCGCRLQHDRIYFRSLPTYRGSLYAADYFFGSIVVCSGCSSSRPVFDRIDKSRSEQAGGRMGPLTPLPYPRTRGKHACHRTRREFCLVDAFALMPGCGGASGRDVCLFHQKQGVRCARARCCAPPFSRLKLLFHSWYPCSQHPRIPRPRPPSPLVVPIPDDGSGTPNIWFGRTPTSCSTGGLRSP